MEIKTELRRIFIEMEGLPTIMTAIQVPIAPNGQATYPPEIDRSGLKYKLYKQSAKGYAMYKDVSEAKYEPEENAYDYEALYKNMCEENKSLVELINNQAREIHGLNSSIHRLKYEIDQLKNGEEIQ